MALLRFGLVEACKKKRNVFNMNHPVNIRDCNVTQSLGDSIQDKVQFKFRQNVRLALQSTKENVKRIPYFLLFYIKHYARMQIFLQGIVKKCRYLNTTEVYFLNRI
ncbi:uncharacterized protein LOC123988279 [Osmia bicornis bicornis]|uniref:uncharacterized protein LOC123988279 n=1 Tax=Osmia bicornis bicornis TaxID=1437191 RepID=UPI001EAE8599|nr:uncharacterized protein LOC123988279 [Osmia bicornis bicornis]